MNSLQKLRQGWDEAARADAMFNILTLAEYQNGGWPPEEFFAHGRREVEAALQYLKEVECSPLPGFVIDFGCGVGRLTQAFGAAALGPVRGLDVSKEMIVRARQFNRFPESQVEYVQTDKCPLPVKARSATLVYTNIVLQHMPNPLKRSYICDFMRMLARDGVLMMQIQDGPDYEHPHHWLSMYGMTEEAVRRSVNRNGGRVRAVRAEPMGQWVSKTYVVTR